MRKPSVYEARKLRRSMSLPEAILWRELRGHSMASKSVGSIRSGLMWRIYVSQANLVIEIDGEAHSRGDAPARDAVRDSYLLGRGIQLLRLPAADVLKNMEDVLTMIADRVANPLHHPADGPPPRAGEDLS